MLTVEFKTNLIAPARGERFVFRASVVKAGRTLTFCEGRAFSVTNGEERLIATMSGTLFAVVEKGSVMPRRSHGRLWVCIVRVSRSLHAEVECRRLKGLACLQHENLPRSRCEVPAALWTRCCRTARCTA